MIKGSLQDTPQGPFHAEDIYQYTHTTLGRLLQPTRSSGIKFPSGISPYVPVAQAHEPDENAGSRLRGVLKPIRTVQQTATPGTNGKGTKQSFTTLQNDSVRGTATPLTTNNTIEARNEWNTSTGYNLRIPNTAVPPVGAEMKSARRFRASTSRSFNSQ